MAVINLESLVLRGVSVLSDGRAINVRLGTSKVAKPQTPGMPVISMPNPLPGYPPTFPGSAGYQESTALAADVDTTVGGAGRSHGSAGFLGSRSLACCSGGLRSTAVRWAKPSWVALSPSVAEIGSRREASQRAAVIKAWHQPVLVTRAVSTRGMSLR
jgi:hypothetical protein